MALGWCHISKFLLMSQATHCPSCATLLKVVPNQLRSSYGWVRCGKCKNVFDATLTLQATTAPVSLIGPNAQQAVPVDAAVATPMSGEEVGSALGFMVHSAGLQDAELSEDMHESFQPCAEMPADEVTLNAEQIPAEDSKAEQEKAHEFVAAHSETDAVPVQEKASFALEPQLAHYGLPAAVRSGGESTKVKANAKTKTETKKSNRKKLGCWALLAPNFPSPSQFLQNLKRMLTSPQSRCGSRRSRPC